MRNLLYVYILSYFHWKAVINCHKEWVLGGPTTLAFSCEKNRSPNQNHQWHYFYMLEKKFVQSENHSSVWVSHQVSCLLVYQTAIFVGKECCMTTKNISWSRSCLELHPIRVNRKNDKTVESYEWGLPFMYTVLRLLLQIHKWIRDIHICYWALSNDLVKNT